MTIVLIIRGKHDAVDKVEIKVFEFYFEARKFCDNINKDFDKESKHYTRAEVIEADKIYEVDRTGID